MGNWSQLREIQSTSPAPWQQPRSGRLEQAAAAGAYLSAYRKTPARAAEVGADVLVPVLKGISLGLASGILVIGPTVLVESWPWYSPLVTILIVTPTSVIGWLFYHQGLLWNHERLEQEPAEAPEAPKPAQPDIVANVRDEESDRPVQRRFTLPAEVTDAKFYDFLSGVLTGGKSLARSDWTGRDKPLSRAQHTQLINELVRLRAVRLADADKPTLGYELTRLGRVMFAGWLEALKQRQNEWL